MKGDAQWSSQIMEENNRLNGQLTHYKKKYSEAQAELDECRKDSEGQLKTLLAAGDISDVWYNKRIDEKQARIERWKAFAKYLYVTSGNKIPECYHDLFNEIEGD